MKKVKIFLASSAELNIDIRDFELFINQKNKDLHQRRIYLELFTWKDFDSSFPENRKQDEYNQYIFNSDISIFLFHTKLGRYTKEEFDIAHTAFISSKSRYKKPRIYTYFKTDLNENRDITEFKDYIDSLGHFYESYDNKDELLNKFNKQLDKLENEGIVLKPVPIDTPKIIKYLIYYFLLPLLVTFGMFFSYYYFQPLNMTVKVTEQNPISGLSFEKGFVSITYGDKTTTLPIHDEIIFKQIPSKYKNNKVELKFSAQGYIPIDTLIKASEIITVPIKRDNSLGLVYGWVRDAETNEPLDDVLIEVKKLRVKTDNSGNFKVKIPRELQDESIRVSALKNGYKPWDFSGSPSQTVPWKINMEKVTTQNR